MELKEKMTFKEMGRHMGENTYRAVSRVSVGRYARELGYRTYKPMIDGRLCFFYVNTITTKEKGDGDKEEI